MIIIKDVRTLDEQVTNFKIPSLKDYTIEANGQLLLLPGLIDPHICLESLKGDQLDMILQAIIKGGITTILDIPSFQLPSDTKEKVKQKEKRVHKILSQLKIPLQWLLYVNASQNHLEEIGSIKPFIKGIVLVFDSNQEAPSEEWWKRVFQLAAWQDLPIIVNSRNENYLPEFKNLNLQTSFLEKAIDYTEKQNTRLYVLNVSKKQEIDLIQKAREKALLIYAETTPEHLFAANSPDIDALWHALNENIIETIGSGYMSQGENEHILLQGETLYLSNPMLLLPFLLNAYHENKISIEKIVQLTHFNIYEIFDIKKNLDAVLVNLEQEYTVTRNTNGNSTNMKIKGWPVYTIAKGQIFHFPNHQFLHLE